MQAAVGEEESESGSAIHTLRSSGWEGKEGAGSWGQRGNQRQTRWVKEYAEAVGTVYSRDWCSWEEEETLQCGGRCSHSELCHTLMEPPGTRQPA